MFVSVHRMDGIIKCTRTCALLRTAHHPAGLRARAKNRMICRSPICKICTTRMGGRRLYKYMHIIPLFAINFKRS
jgi:hypothetical protein